MRIVLIIQIANTFALPDNVMYALKTFLIKKDETTLTKMVCIPDCYHGYRAFLALTSHVVVQDSS